MKSINKFLLRIRSKKGFTIVELLVVIGIIGILVAMSMGSFNSFIKKAKETAIINDIRSVSDAIERYSVDGSTDDWIKGAVTIDEIEDGLVYDADGLTKSPKLANTSIVPDEVVKDAGSRLKGSFYSGGNNDVIYSEKKNDGKVEKEKELSESEVDKLVKDGYIPVANKSELEGIRTNNGVETTWGKGTKWEKKYTGTLGSKYVQVKNIDMSGVNTYEPLGDSSSPFTGEYHGANHTIGNLTIAKELNGSIFGYVDGNIKVNNLNVEDYRSSGSVIATNVSSSAIVNMSNIGIHNVKVNSDGNAGTLFSKIDKPVNMTANNISVSGSVHGDSDLGGLIGNVAQEDTKFSFDNLKVNIEVFGKGEYADLGGLIGRFESKGGEVSVLNSMIMIDVSGSSEAGGLIGYVDEDDGIFSIENLVLVGNVSSKKCSNCYGGVGGLVGEFSWDDRRSLTVNNVDMYLEVSGYRAGGISGEFDGDYNKIHVNNYTMYGDVISSVDTGGIIGELDDDYNDVYVANYTMYGNIISSGDAGGIIGEIDDDYNSIYVSNYTMYGNVTGLSDTGGIIGELDNDYNNIIISNYTMNGNISGNKTGGVIGDLDDGENIIEIDGFYMYGNIDGTSETGGVFGEVALGDINTITINDFNMYGDITGLDCTGGIAGEIDSDEDIINVYNSVIHGNITGESYTGGFVGNFYGDYSEVNIDGLTINGNIYGTDAGGFIGTLNGDYNIINVSNFIAKGDVTGTSTAGGFIGDLDDDYNTVNVNNFDMYGDVIGVEGAGGLLGEVDKGDNNIINVNNFNMYGNVYGDSDTGGLIGNIIYENEVSVANSTIHGEVVGKGNTGGAVGTLSNSLIDMKLESFNVQKQVKGAGYTGGLFGEFLAKSVNAKDIQIKESVIGELSTGGIVGYLTKGDLTISNSKVKGSIEGPDAGEVFGKNEGNITENNVKFSGKLKPTN